ncbi:Mercuric reductase [Dirofilaria immitis]
MAWLMSETLWLALSECVHLCVYVCYCRVVSFVCKRCCYCCRLLVRVAQARLDVCYDGGLVAAYGTIQRTALA